MKNKVSGYQPTEKLDITNPPQGDVSRTTLAPTEPHPSIELARNILLSKNVDLHLLQEAYASCAIEGNRLAEVCVGTINRLINHEPVSDRYFMGLVFAIIYKDYEKEIGN